MEGKSQIKLRLWPLLVSATLGVGGAWALQGPWRTPLRNVEGEGTAEAPEVEPRAGPGIAVGAAPAAEVAGGEGEPGETPAPPPAPPGVVEGPPPHEPEASPAQPARASTGPAVVPALAAAVFRSPLPPAAKLRFREIWAYLMPGEESLWPESSPLTDLGLFDFSLDPTGRLKGRANVGAIERAVRLGIRPHLVVASSGNSALLHFALTPRYGVREALLREIAELPRRHPVAGVQLDLESARSEEGPHLVSFARELKASLPEGVILSLALPAKRTDGPGAYVYADLAGAADRYFLMAYDQHWKGGPPGPISGLSWLEQVLACAARSLPVEQVVVGLPFYGRVWQREEVARALKYSGVERTAAESAAQVRYDPPRSHSFSYRAEVTAECWYEDALSLRTKLESVRARGFRSVGFWRLGQEDPRVWEVLEGE